MIASLLLVLTVSSWVVFDGWPGTSTSSDRRQVVVTSPAGGSPVPPAPQRVVVGSRAGRPAASSRRTPASRRPRGSAKPLRATVRPTRRRGSAGGLSAPAGRPASAPAATAPATAPASATPGPKAAEGSPTAPAEQVAGEVQKTVAEKVGGALLDMRDALP